MSTWVHSTLVSEVGGFPVFSKGEILLMWSFTAMKIRLIWREAFFSSFFFGLSSKKRNFVHSLPASLQSSMEWHNTKRNTTLCYVCSEWFYTGNSFCISCLRSACHYICDIYKHTYTQIYLQQQRLEQTWFQLCYCKSNPTHKFIAKSSLA